MADQHYYKTHCKISEDKNKGIVKISGPDIFTRNIYTVEIKTPEYEAIENGVSFQNAIRSVSAEDREFLISGLAPSSFPEDPDPEGPSPFSVDWDTKVNSASGAVSMDFDAASALAKQNLGVVRRDGRGGFFVRSKDGDIIIQD